MSEEKKQAISGLKKKLSPVLEKLIGHLIVVKPEDPIAYMLHFMEKQKGIETKKLSAEERIKLSELRTKHRRYRK